jgi:intracellular sulfur oxidation DsrE/DsrF family protein
MSEEQPVRRRGFFAALAAGGSAFAATLGIPRGASAQVQAQSHELDRWMDELRGRHKQIFDCVSVAHIAEMAYARNFLSASADYGLKDEDMSVIVSLRHEATPYAYNDAMWEKYKIGEALNVPQPRGGGRGAPPDTTPAAQLPRATRNPQMGLITDLAGRGVRFTACSLSTGRYSSQFARATGQQAADVRAELIANLVPNARIVPAGVVVLNRAQERGFSYLHVG